MSDLDEKLYHSDTNKEASILNLEFTDAIAIAKGCTDYSGGYRYDPELYEAYQAGILTVVTALQSAAKNGMDSQTSVLHAIGTNW